MLTPSGGEGGNTQGSTLKSSKEQVESLGPPGPRGTVVTLRGAAQPHATATSSVEIAQLAAGLAGARLASGKLRDGGAVEVAPVGGSTAVAAQVRGSRGNISLREAYIALV